MGTDSSFFENCAFVSVDLQEDTHSKIESIPDDWKANGFTIEDVQAAWDFLFETAQPNAARAVKACRAAGMPVILIHWGYQFENAMDLDPEVRESFLKGIGPDFSKWPHHLSHPTSRPASILDPQTGDYILAKTAQDSFKSCNIDFVLRNLKVKNIIFVGGHTGACLYKTAKSAKERGYKLLCLEDATFDARESMRRHWIDDLGYDYVMTTNQFLEQIHEGDPQTR